MKSLRVALLILVSAMMAAGTAWAHFGMLIPSDAMVMPDDNRSVTVTLSFSHPFEMVGMDMTRPKAFGVVTRGVTQDLAGSLEATRVMGHRAWQSVYRIKRPGVYVFIMEPQPYWESAEDTFIVHYTKTVVAAFGEEQGWDAEIGLKTEIVPLSRPFGLYAGNVFQGIVKLDGKPLPFAGVEVEYYNIDQKYTAPTDYMITQSIQADGNGVFTYAAPVDGWWGFAALNPAGYKLPYNGEEKDVELGAVIWVYFHNMK